MLTSGWIATKLAPVSKEVFSMGKKADLVFRAVEEVLSELQIETGPTTGTITVSLEGVKPVGARQTFESTFISAEEVTRVGVDKLNLALSERISRLFDSVVAIICHHDSSDGIKSYVFARVVSEKIYIEPIMVKHNLKDGSASISVGSKVKLTLS
jgi:hypothetical protein